MEGPVGNVPLKAGEGMADMFIRTVAQELMQTLQNEKHLAKKAFENLEKKYQYHEAARPCWASTVSASFAMGPATVVRFLPVARGDHIQNRRLNEQIEQESRRSTLRQTPRSDCSWRRFNEAFPFERDL
ncbi:MAG: hypothetical protein U0872_17040 [Planctomycetaceae bacterium]